MAVFIHCKRFVFILKFSSNFPWADHLRLYLRWHDPFPALWSYHLPFLSLQVGGSCGFPLSQILCCLVSSSLESHLFLSSFLEEFLCPSNISDVEQLFLTFCFFSFRSHPKYHLLAKLYLTSVIFCHIESLHSVCHNLYSLHDYCFTCMLTFFSISQ